MIPDYSTSHVHEYSINDMQQLADEWFDASKNNLSSKEAQGLFQKTGKVITYLKNQESSINSPNIQTSECEFIAKKIIELGDAFINQFNKHGVNESKFLAQWIAEYTGPEERPYTSFHGIVEFMKSVKSVDFVESQDLWNNQTNLAIIDNEVGKKIQIPDHDDAKSALFSELEKKELLAMRTTSKQNKKIVDELLINGLNDNTISFADLKIFSIEASVNFFGEGSSKLLVPLPFDITSKHDEKTIEKIIQNCPNIRSVTLSKGVQVTEQLLILLNSLKSLKVFAFTRFNDPEAFKSVIKHCPHLEVILLEDI